MNETVWRHDEEHASSIESNHYYYYISHYSNLQLPLNYYYRSPPANQRRLSLNHSLSAVIEK